MARWLDLLYLRLNKHQRKWIDTSWNEDAVEARWLEAIIDTAPDDCEDQKKALEAIVNRIVNTNKHVEDYYESYEVEIPEDDVWNVLQKQIGKKLFVMPVGNTNFELKGTIPSLNALKIETEKFYGFLFLDKGVTVCWEK